MNLNGAVRNPLAHDPKIEWDMNEQDALDIMTMISLVHRKKGQGQAWTIDTLDPYRRDLQITQFEDPNGHATNFTYDAKGLLLTDEDAAGSSKTLDRTLSERNQVEVEFSNGEGKKTQYHLERFADESKQMTVTFPDGTVNQSTEDRKKQVVDQFADGTRVTKTVGPDPRWGMRSPVPESTTVAMPSGLTKTVNVEKTTSPTPLVDLMNFTTITEKTTVNGKEYTDVYTASTKQWESTTPENRKSYATVDTLGRVTEAWAQGLESVQITYDDEGRIDTVQAGATAPRLYQFTYDDRGYLDSVTDPIGQTTSYINDEVGRVLTTVLPDTREIGFSYDAAGNLTSITPPGKPTHELDYTPVNLLDTYIPPALGGVPNVTTQYTYNLNRDLERITRPDGQTIDYVYDTAGRLSTVNLPGAEQYVRTYNPTTGKLATLTSPDGATLSYTYDGSLLTSETLTGPVQGAIHYTYDNNFKVTGIGFNGGNVASYTYDDDGVMETAAAVDLIPNPTTGLLDGTILDNVTSSNTYNGFGELTAETYSVSAAPVYQVSYTRDALGRIAGRTEMIEGETTNYEYEYDLAGRLTDVYLNGDTNPTSHYDYDDNGNRVSTTRQSLGDGGASTVTVDNGVYDDQDRMLTYGNAADGYTEYEYSDNGELTTRRSLGEGGQTETTSYTYDVLGNLRAVTLPDNTEIAYIIDGRNRRVGKIVDGVLEYGLLYQGSLRPIAELDTSGAVVSRFVYGSKSNVPDYFTSDKADGSTWVTYRIISDQVGSPRLVINSTTGAVVQRIDYDEFGRVTEDTNPGFQPFGFAGGLYDPDTGLVRFGARDYDAETGRWTAKDPIRFKGGDTNLYGYVFSDPVNWIDPYGEAYVPPGGVCDDSWWAWASTMTMPDPFSAFTAAAFTAAAAGIYALVSYFAEHTKNKRKGNWDKHTNKRSGGPEKADPKRTPWDENPNKPPKDPTKRGKPWKWENNENLE